MYNFSAGPGVLPKEVLLEAQKDFIDFKGSGISIIEASHRGKVYEPVHNECIALFRELMNIPDNYDVLLVQGGASTQFEAVPLNLLKKGRADYIVTGNFAKKAYKEAQKYGDVRVAASSEDKNFTYIPDFDDSSFRSDIDYVHCTSNNTIYGSRMRKFPSVETLVCDMSSNILSEVYDVNKFGVIYAGAQKNISCAGVPSSSSEKTFSIRRCPFARLCSNVDAGKREQPLQHSPLFLDLHRKPDAQMA